MKSNFHENFINCFHTCKYIPNYIEKEPHSFVLFCVVFHFVFIILVAGDMMKLTELKSGSSGRIKHIQLPQEAQKRLRYVGIYCGAWVRVERSSWKRKPLILLACGNFLMLRYADAQEIEVEQ